MDGNWADWSDWSSCEGESGNDCVSPFFANLFDSRGVDGIFQYVADFLRKLGIHLNFGDDFNSLAHAQQRNLKALPGLVCRLQSAIIA